MIELTQGQKEVLEESIKILETKEVLVITGKAGTGKTTLVNFLVRELIQFPRHKNKKILCCAPTNKAVKVLRDKMDKSTNFDFRTVHSALKLRREIHPKTGEISFKPDYTVKNDPLAGASLLIVDEASMLNSELLELVLEGVLAKNIKIVFIGDEGQLPPVGEETSPVFHSNFPTLELTEIVRQGSGNPIITLSRNLNLLRSKRDDRRELGGYIFSNNRLQVIETLAHVNGTDDLKYLAWTNQDVDSINKAVRERIYTNPAKIEIGESLVFDIPYGDHFTNDEITVETLEVKENLFEAYNVPNPAYNMDTMKDEPEKLISRERLKYYVINGNVKVIHEDSEAIFKEILKQFRILCKSQQISWKKFYEFKETFAAVKYNHALTIHKSQGSSYKQVIININNCMWNKNIKEREKLLYTAVTRASELVVLYNA